MTCITAADSSIAALLAELSAPLEPIATSVTPRVQALLGIKAIVFDVYGTLLCSGVGDISVDQATDRDPALREAMEAVGLTVARGKRFREKWVQEVRAHQDMGKQQGVEYPEVDICCVWGRFLEKMQAEGLLSGDLDSATLTRASVEYECRVNPAWPMPGFQALLDTLKAEHFHLGIISNAQFFTPTLLEVLSGKSLESLGFEEGGCLWSYRLLEAKPSVRLYQKSAMYWESVHGIHPGEVLYVGNDLLNDIWPAQKVGFRTALFAGDARSLRMHKGDTRVEGVAADLVITELNQIASAVHS